MQELSNFVEARLDRCEMSQCHTQIAVMELKQAMQDVARRMAHLEASGDATKLLAQQLESLTTFVNQNLLQQVRTDEFLRTHDVMVPIFATGVYPHGK